jgi:hypothetical protein
MRYMVGEHSTKRKKEMAASQDLRVRGGTGSKNSMGWIFALFAIAFALAGTTTACAPIPCPAGYADPDWCNHFRGGGGGGVASASPNDASALLAAAL